MMKSCSHVLILPHQIISSSSQGGPSVIPYDSWDGDLSDHGNDPVIGDNEVGGCSENAPTTSSSSAVLGEEY